MHEFVTAHPLAMKSIAGALSGATSAASVDFAAFRTWKTWQDGIKYDWTTATFRWFQGAVVGAATGLGIGAITGA